MSNLRAGINASRRIGGGLNNNISEEIKSVRTQGAMPLFQTAVVTEIIYDPNLLTLDEKNNLASLVVNPRAVANMPRNSILVRVISNSNDIGDPRPRIIYPFFQSHFALPLKTGEQVFIVYPDPHLDGHEQGYWLTRVPESAAVEDLNFTHSDRKYDQILNPENLSTSERANNSTDTSNVIPNFQNGAGTPESLSLFVSGTNDKPYDTIYTNSTGSRQITFEAIPRFIKRPADFAIVGSNNARIVIGEDRTGPATRVTASNQKSDKTGKAGSIDIVVGVGGTRNMPESKDDDPVSTNPDKRPTAPRVIENTRHKLEVDKVPFLRNKQDNSKEGDPDFKRDLSRVYISMKTAGDKNFKINFGGDGGIFPNSSNKLNTEIVDLPSGDEDGQPFIINKSEHIRFIASGKDKDSSYGGPLDHGDIFLIKEGNETDKDLGILGINKQGEVVIIGKNIQLHTHDEGKVFIKCKDGEEANADPMVLYSNLKITLDKIIDTIADLAGKVGDQFSDLGNNGFAVPNATFPFGPVPAIISAKIQCIASKAQMEVLKNTLSLMKSTSADNAKIADLRSKWVYISKDKQ